MVCLWYAYGLFTVTNAWFIHSLLPVNSQVLIFTIFTIHKWSPYVIYRHSLIQMQPHWSKLMTQGTPKWHCRQKCTMFWVNLADIWTNWCTVYYILFHFQIMFIIPSLKQMCGHKMTISAHILPSELNFSVTNHTPG